MLGSLEIFACGATSSVQFCNSGSIEISSQSALRSSIEIPFSPRGRARATVTCISVWHYLTVNECTHDVSKKTLLCIKSPGTVYGRSFENGRYLDLFCRYVFIFCELFKRRPHKMAWGPPLQGSNVLGGAPEDTDVCPRGVKAENRCPRGVPPRNVLGGSGACPRGVVCPRGVRSLSSGGVRWRRMRKFQYSALLCIDFPLGNSISAPWNPKIFACGALGIMIIDIHVILGRRFRLRRRPTTCSAPERTLLPLR